MQFFIAGGSQLVQSWPGPEPAAKRASHSAAQGACQVSGAKLRVKGDVSGVLERNSIRFLFLN